MPAVRMFTNGNRDSTALIIYPDGLVEVIVENEDGESSVVEYLNVDGIRQFVAQNHELSRIVSPVLDASEWWIATHHRIPTFYLNGAVQGIRDVEHARVIAIDITGIDDIHIARLTDIIS